MNFVEAVKLASDFSRDSPRRCAYLVLPATRGRPLVLVVRLQTSEKTYAGTHGRFSTYRCPFSFGAVRLSSLLFEPGLNMHFAEAVADDWIAYPDDCRQEVGA